MRRLINSTYVTLDGVITDPQDWPSMGGFSDAGTVAQTQLLASCDAVLLGRETYEAFAPVWSARSGDPLSDRMNSIAKYVVSRTSDGSAWQHTTVIDHDPVEAVRDLKEKPGADIVQYGFGPLAHALMGAGLLDELRLWLHPFFVGTGGSDDLLHHAGSAATFELADTLTLDSGIVILTYRS